MLSTVSSKDHSSCSVQSVHVEICQRVACCSQREGCCNSPTSRQWDWYVNQSNWCTTTECTSTTLDTAQRTVAASSKLVDVNRERQVSGRVDCGKRRNVYDKKPQHYVKDNRTAHLTACSDKSVAYRVSTTPGNPGNLLEFKWSSWKFLCNDRKLMMWHCLCIEECNIKMLLML